MRMSRGHTAVGTTALLAAVSVTGCGLIGDDAPDSGHSTTRPDQPTRRAPVWDPSPASVAAVGDSITRGFDACSVLSDCPEVSWSTGSDKGVRSLAVRLLGRTGAAERSWNHARSGARMADLNGQMRRAAAHRPGLVTVLAGANDACRDTAAAMTPVSDFRSQFETAMRTLRRASPRTQVYVSSVPDLKRLWSEGRANPLGKQIWKLGICPSMLADADAVDARATQRRDSVLNRVVEYNTVLREVCAADQRCRFDDNAVFDYRFGTGQLSPWDWFHPSKNGQSRLAEIAYRAVTAKTPADSAAPPAP
ncbi:SGNH/GDSL hydrolase family protein [Streptomyces sp. NA04227]|uniref:SGNH/GDSL hydrolase family protein n=1 Tax=Streptomyces sp. NA04227 TaxID=2742136 RepID=UPI0015921717|nr:SGNH/GDSL hydrolase family protein [Streptomyces sp. NA04227]QKW06308.1 SGNH/GDSL hydrolase family protein [Streptomyces sp. NA04227]